MSHEDQWKTKSIYSACFKENTCYTFHTSPKPWEESNKICQQNDGNLVSMETEQEYQFINKTIQGLNIAGTYNEWYIGLRKRSGVWKWVSNHTLTINKWMPRRPDGHGDCVIIAKEYPPGYYGLFNDLRCDIHKMFICKYKKETPCSCYTLHTSPKPWTESNKICQQNGGNLVSMETEQEYQFINKTIQGLNIAGTYNEWYIGLRKRSGVWKWVSDNRLTINKWQPGQPDGHGDCVVIVKEWPPGYYGLFNDLRCDIHRMFICEYKKGIQVCAKTGTKWCPVVTNTTTTRTPTTTTTEPHYVGK